MIGSDLEQDILNFLKDVQSEITFDLVMLDRIEELIEEIEG